MFMEINLVTKMDFQSPFMSKLTHSPSPDVNDRYDGFVSVDGKKINQLDRCQLLDDEVFHIQAIFRA